MQLARRRHAVSALDSLLEGVGMVLVDLGYLDAGRLRAVVRQAMRDRRGCRPIPSYLHEVLVVERSIAAWSS